MKEAMEQAGTHRRTRSGPRSSRLRVAFFAFCATICPLALTLPQVLAQDSLNRQLRSILSTKPDPTVKASACVIEIPSGRVVFAHDADSGMVPASTMKVFVMVAALALLGPDFSFETRLATDGTDLVVVGDGDPGFGDEKLHRRRGEAPTAAIDRWAKLLVDGGVRSIPGDLIIDESIFDGQLYHPTWEESDRGKWYAAPVGALNFNNNCVDITVTPSKLRDAPAIVSVFPSANLLDIVNKCRSGGKGTPVLHHPPGTNTYRISGRCSKRWPFVSVPFPDPGLLFADSLRSALRQQGIEILGSVRRQRVLGSGGELPANLSVLASSHTPLQDILLRIGKDSQNLFAECLLKRVGYEWAKRGGSNSPQGSWTSGREAVRAILEGRGMRLNGFRLADGSGLSRENRCTARQLASVLAWASNRSSFPILHDNLSIGGVDGSLRKQLRDIPGQVHAKTGTMTGVRSLAGYVDGGQGSRYAFAILYNGYKGPSRPYKDLQDRFCRALASSRK